MHRNGQLNFLIFDTIVTINFLTDCFRLLIRTKREIQFQYVYAPNTLCSQRMVIVGKVTESLHFLRISYSHVTGHQIYESETARVPIDFPSEKKNSELIFF